MAKGKFSKPRTGAESEVFFPDFAENTQEQAVFSAPAPMEIPQQEITLADLEENIQAATEDGTTIPEFHSELPDQQDADLIAAQEEPEEEMLISQDDEIPAISPVVRKNRKIALISVCVAVLVLLIGAGITYAYLFGVIGDDGLILHNVTVAGVNLGGMTQAEAEKALHEATDLTYTGMDMVVKLPNETIVLSPANTGAVLDVKAAAQAAFDFGRTGTLRERRSAKAQALLGEYNIALLNCLSLNTEYIYNRLEAAVSAYNSTYTPSSYSFEGEMPNLNGENFDVSTPCQTLMLYVGTPEQNIDLNSLYNQVLDAYSFNQFLVDVSSTTATQLPEPIDLEAILAQCRREPSSASMDMTTMEIDVYENFGYTFDVDYAALMLSTARYGETVGIPMQYVVPEVTSASLKAMLYRDVLSYAQTKHTTNQNRNNNLALACAAINGYVLMPGETFSYNEVVGERTAEAGYKHAPAYASGQTVMELGGGICQVSSTLYYACLLADMEIVDRTNHSYVSSYIDFGMDATVSWGGPEFIFRNNTSYPVRIDAEVSDGYVKIQLVGTDLKDYYVVMTYRVTSYTAFETIYEEYPPDNPEGYKDGDVVQSPYNGYTVRTYRCKYDKITNELISEEEEAFSKYKVRDKIIAVIIDPEAPSESEETTPAD